MVSEDCEVVSQALNKVSQMKCLGENFLRDEPRDEIEFDDTEEVIWS